MPWFVLFLLLQSLMMLALLCFSLCLLTHSVYSLLCRSIVLVSSFPAKHVDMSCKVLNYVMLASSFVFVIGIIAAIMMALRNGMRLWNHLFLTILQMSQMLWCQWWWRPQDHQIFHLLILAWCMYPPWLLVNYFCSRFWCSKVLELEGPTYHLVSIWIPNLWSNGQAPYSISCV